MYNKKPFNTDENSIEKKKPKKKEDKDKNLQKKLPFYKVFPSEFILTYINK